MTDSGTLLTLQRTLYVFLSFAGGIGLGLFYFGSLWYTLKYLPRIRRPELVMVGSFFARTAITLLGFYLLLGGRWERLLFALGGFILVRFFMTRRLRVHNKKRF